MITVLTKRLFELSGLNLSEENSHFAWDGELITVKDVVDYLEAGKNGTAKPYGDTWRFPPVMQNKEYHVSQVAYFVQNPSKITGIEVGNPWYNFGGCQTVIVDGYHRLMAAYISGLDKIKIRYGGRRDVENYLKGKRETPPVE